MIEKSADMIVPLLDLKPQLKTLRDDMAAAMLNVLDSTQYIMGPKVEQFEQEIADYVGAGHGIGVSSGTDALLLALMALDVGPEDHVITTPFSFFATAGVIVRLGARPVFVDIDPGTFNLDPARLDDFLKTRSKDDLERIKAIIPIHLYGQCADMEAILQIADSYGIPIIEDAAQAIGAEYPGKGGINRAGAMGRMGCFSFFPSKNLGAVGDAGMVTTNDDRLADILRIKRVHGGAPKYYHEVIGGNFRLDPLQASVLSVKLPHLDGWHRQRQENAKTYERLIAEHGLDRIVTPNAVYEQAGLANYHIYNQFVIRTPRRDELRSFLGDNGVSTDIYYPVPFHEQGCFRFMGHSKGDFPESERAAQDTLAMPIYPELTGEMQAYVIEKMAEFFSA